MAWIKFDTATPDKPEVWQMAAALGVDADAVVGKLLRVWAWFDTHSENGNAPSVSKVTLDRHVGNAGFCDSMLSVGWMADDGETISLPNFDRHNGETAKKRALTASRVAKHKRSGNADGNASSVKTALPREEKRREDIKAPHSPQGGSGHVKRKQANAEQFEAFWKAYPKKTAKQDAEKAFAKINPDQPLFALMMDSLSRACRSADWQKDGGQFVPYPATWLNGRRWEDLPLIASAGQPESGRVRRMLPEVPE